MLDGAVLRGTIDGEVMRWASVDGESGSDRGAGGLQFESEDGDSSFELACASVKMIWLSGDGALADQESPRFFDTAPIPAFLWVRVTFRDGEVVEGMMRNRWEAFHGPLLYLSIPNTHLNQMHVFISRAAIAELQVITTR